MMAEAAAYFHEFNIVTVSLRLVMAMVVGASIGIERGRKGSPAGLRTYMFVSLGAALTMLISQYDYHMIHGQWAELSAAYGFSIDVSRYSAKVTSGIGFLAAGTILVNRRQKVKGLTSAASLWASACMGIVVGAGFYGCVLAGFLMILICNLVLSPVSTWVAEQSRDMNVYVEYTNFGDLQEILHLLRGQDIEIYDIDIARGKKKRGENPSAVLSFRLPKHLHHSSVAEALLRLTCVQELNEV